MVRGRGPVLFACHGGPANVHDTLALALAPLEAAHTIVYHDYRGSGRSQDAPPATYTFEQLADDLDELRGHLGHESVPVLAHSMGGFVALSYALRHPGSCAGLVLVSTTPTGDPAKIAWPTLRALGVPRLAKLTARAIWYLAAWAWRPESPRRRTARYAIVGTTQEGLPSTRARVREVNAMLPAPNDNVPHLEPLFSRTDLTPALSSITAQTLVLYGQRDAMMVAGGQLLQAGIPNVTTIALAKVGHEPFLEAPEQAFPPIRNFLATISG